MHSLIPILFQKLDTSSNRDQRWLHQVFSIQPLGFVDGDDYLVFKLNKALV